MPNELLSGTVLDKRVSLSISEICQACTCQNQWIVELVEYGILEPSGADLVDWRFSSESLSRAFTARRLQRDLGINVAGIALAIDLLEQLETLQTKLGVQVSMDNDSGDRD